MKIIFDVRLVFPSLLFVCSLFPQRTEAASQLCSAGASHGDGCTLSAHCVGSGVALEWETVGYPQVDVLHLEYQKNNGEHHTVVRYYLHRQGSHTFLAPEGGQVIWTFSGCYHDDFWTEFSVTSLTLTCGDTAQEEADVASEPPVSATSTSSTVQTSLTTVQPSSVFVQPSPSFEAPTPTQTGPAHVVTSHTSSLDIEPDVELKYVKESGEEVKSANDIGGSKKISGRERRGASDITMDSDNRVECRGLPYNVYYFIGALIGASVAVIIAGALVVAKHHKQSPAPNIYVVPIHYFYPSQ